MKTIKQKSVSELKRLQAEIKEELKIRGQARGSLLDSFQTKEIEFLVRDVKRLMKGKTFTLKVRPEIPVKVTVCLTEMPNVTFLIHNNYTSSIWDFINKALGKDEKVVRYLDRYNRELADVDEELAYLEEKYKIDECDIFDAVCAEAAKDIKFAPGYGTWG